MMDTSSVLVIVPPNDEEAYLIADIAERLGCQVHRSTQPHGARLEHETNILEFVRMSSAHTVMIVEMPGPKIEEAIRAMGKHLVIIDHHNYTDLTRAYDPSGNPLPSSLEQFLRFFEVADVQLKRFGYDPLLVRAVGLWDAGYIWALIDAGYTRADLEKFLTFKDAIAEKVGTPEVGKRHQEAAAAAWAAREPFGKYLVVVSQDPLAHIRSNVSRLAAMEFWKPTPVIISERAGKRLYVQETDRAMELFAHFGGFTFGTNRNWGYDNDAQGEEKVTLAHVKEFLYES